MPWKECWMPRALMKLDRQEHKNNEEDVICINLYRPKGSSNLTSQYKKLRRRVVAQEEQ